MSWNATIGPVTGSDAETAIDALSCEIDPTTGDPATPEVEEQIALAKKLTKQAVNSGALGDTSAEFQITISGHANPNHDPAAEGASSADGIGIRVDQTSGPLESEPPDGEPE